MFNSAISIAFFNFGHVKYFHSVILPILISHFVNRSERALPDFLFYNKFLRDFSFSIINLLFYRFILCLRALSCLGEISFVRFVFHWREETVQTSLTPLSLHSSQQQRNLINFAISLFVNFIFCEIKIQIKIFLILIRKEVFPFSLIFDGRIAFFWHFLTRRCVVLSFFNFCHFFEIKYSFYSN